MNCLELFAGCGGLGFGFHKEGFNIVCANELEASIGETYKHNFPTTNVVIGDITKKNVKKQIYDSFKDKDCNIVIGGPPCVAYSMSGHRNSRDPRGQLFNDYVAIVKKLKPDIFVMENVKGILTILHDKPKLNEKEKELADKYYELEKKKIEYTLKKKVLSAKSKKMTDSEETITEEMRSLHKTEVDENNALLKKTTIEINKMKKDIPQFRMHVTDIIKERFNKLGYNVNMKLLNSANYGVPQKRERVIFIGVKKNLKKDIPFPTPTHSKEGEDETLKKWVTVKDAIDDLKIMEENYDFQQIYTNHSNSVLEKIKKTPIGKSMNPKYTEAFFKCDPNKPSNTVKENHGGVFLHYEKPRVMTPRELARLQSFPDDFIFKGSKSCMLVQLGNAVPCKLGQAIAKEIKKKI
jgi:DNA (cytosine-5)-methyltransferase 1